MAYGLKIAGPKNEIAKGEEFCLLQLTLLLIATLAIIWQPEVAMADNCKAPKGVFV